ncbi:MAG: hypothetical protein CL693_00185 [Cellvibrionaceae bacterium]|nr:hypothetical protein [Cellvibrionaceae bacterium]
MISALIKFVVPIGLILVGMFQTLYYRKIKGVFSQLPTVAVEITESKLHDNPWSDSGRREYEAIIYYKYSFRGKPYTGNTPALRGYNLWPDYEYEWVLLDKYKKGDIVNAKVLPANPNIAYLEVAPLHKKSAILMPFVSLAYLAFIWGYFYLVGEALF